MSEDAEQAWGEWLAKNPNADDLLRDSEGVSWWADEIFSGGFTAGGVAALEQAADTIQPGDHTCFKMWCPECAVRKVTERTQSWLRARAQQLRDQA